MHRRVIVSGIIAAATVGIVAPSFAQPVPAPVVRHDSSGTAVGTDEVGVTVSNSGLVCPQVSTQDWQCVQLP